MGRAGNKLVKHKNIREVGETSSSTSAIGSDSARHFMHSATATEATSHVSIDVLTRDSTFLEQRPTIVKELKAGRVSVPDPGNSSDDEAQGTSNPAIGQNIILERFNTMAKSRDDSTYANFALRRSRSRQRSGRNGYVTLADESYDDPIADLPEDYKRLKMSPMGFVEYIVLPLVIVALLLSIFIPSLARHMFWGFHLWRWLMLIIAVISNGVFAIWVTHFFIFLIERIFFLRIRLLYFIYGVHASFQSCIWVLSVFLAWVFLFDERMTGETKAHLYITKIFFCLMVATSFRLVKNILLKVLASSFHVNSYFDRIQDALLNQCIIEKLSIPTHRESPKLARTVAKKDYTKRIDFNQLHKLDKNTISSWSMRKLVKIMKYGTLTVLDESSMQILSEHEAELAARKIFSNVASPGAKFIYQHDLKDVMDIGEVEKILCLLGGTLEDGVSKIALKNWVVSAYKDRRALTFTLNDTKTVVKRLHQIANVIVGIIVICVWLIILNIATTNYFVFVGTSFFAVISIFGDTLRKLFDSVIFLFSSHHFNVGDHCEVNGTQLVVEKMNLLTTTFRRFDKVEIKLQNNKLSELWIYNFQQGFGMEDKIDFNVHISTPLTMIAVMKERLISFMEGEGHWYPDTEVVIHDLDPSENKLKISITMHHRLKFHDMKMKMSRRELIVQELVRVLSDVGIVQSLR